MTGLTIKGRFDGLDKVQNKIKGLGSDRRQKLNDNIAAALESGTLERFETQKSPEGKPWKSNIRGGRKLYLSGGLYDDVTSQANDRYAEVGVTKIYGAIHQVGGTIKAKLAKCLCFKIGKQWVKKRQVTIPARPYLGVSKSDEAEIGRQISKFLSEQLS